MTKQQKLDKIWTRAIWVNDLDTYLKTWSSCLGFMWVGENLLWILVSYTRFDYLFFMPLIFNSLSLSLSPYSMIIWAKTWNKMSFHWAERLLKIHYTFPFTLCMRNPLFFPIKFGYLNYLRVIDVLSIKSCVGAW